ncbi:peptidyl-tRNA hydrolase [Candidatus Woesearchaeota archaeon]|nr:peptidyl-tRNA hydrolase [Candidatus Woesearchaeota archaeon]
MVNYKQVILVREDLKLPKGKLSAQVAHASVDAMLKTPKKIIDAWRAEGMGKIVLKVKDEAELRRYRQLAEQKGLVTALITDAGKTVLAPGTVTCLGIGPDDESIIDKVTGNLKMV